ncbi:MAG: amidohydrolase [Alphaproteobacteria bacterium]|nr:amidohydrolase [Alphaproteobacteria bacterium]
MPVINRVAAFHDDMKAWRREIHSRPELCFEEKRTADLVAEKLASFGVEIHRGLATTGVVGTLRAGTSDRAIGLRADLDALPMGEDNTFSHRSLNAGRMHACGHDGHTAMLLGAARYLAETRNFDGTVHFIFQPAEEGGGGGRVMVEEGLFDRFPVEAVYGMHNWPGLEAGRFSVRPGPMMASADQFDLTIRGLGTHGAMPHRGVDPVVCACQIVTALQTIASRETNPLESVVISVTQIHAGEAYNVIPNECVLRGTVRAFEPKVRDGLPAAIERIATGIARAMGCEAALVYKHGYPPLVNTAAEVRIAAEAMAEVVGADRVTTDGAATMGSEDFAFMLEAKPGAYVFLGNGATASLHNPKYDFNDDILPVGASYWATLVEQTLARRSATKAA